jgi:hypothetical protein
MIECYASACPARGTHYVENPTTRAPFYLCGKHANDHALGFGFELDTHLRLALPKTDEPAEALLTGSGADAILTLPAHTIARGGAMYSTISKAVSILQDSYSEADEALSDIQQKISELEDAASELENLKDQLSGAISSLEELDGASVSVDVDSVSVYISL